MTAFLLYEQSGPVVTLTMNSPQTRNALTGNNAPQEFFEACERIARDASVRVVILTATGTVFSSGGNLKHMQELFDASPAALRTWYREGIQRVATALYNLDVPTIAAVNGPAIGAGCDLTCMCDIRIASEAASFSESFVKVGLIPGDGGAWLLPRVVGMSKAAEMTFTGDAVSAAEALACGLVSLVVPADRLMDEARSLANRIAANPGGALRLSKRLLREGQHMRLESLLEMSAGFQALAHKTPQHVEAVNAFVEKRKPVFGDD
ncbi:crotonase/enoyl-CoA hydratase family protein [Thermomonas sp.]|uniref:crotonase/enoyl-CoA hydratase family protein n=1 Tax=Thermomonas sp. TaxID=1971895 RepID=UPI002488CD1C|nr:crotonase/enoyl-CoA hydratase family protein [Thermomonas sp.]MDI1251562.1 crotonase/enoyl-CoA hydratase family protein [Thermomonas sp.]